MINYATKMICILSFTLLTSSCSLFQKTQVDLHERNDVNSNIVDINRDLTKSEVQKLVAQSYRKEAINIIIKADSDLNRFASKAHTLYLCIYQLRDPNGFNQLVEENDGISKLLECSRFDTTVTNAKKFVLQPAQELNDLRDRAEGARYIAVVAGYYSMKKEKVTKLFALPTVSLNELSVNTIRLDLGPLSIASIRVK